MKKQAGRHATRAANGHLASSDSHMRRQKMQAVAAAVAGVVVVGVVAFLVIRPKVLPSAFDRNAAVAAVGVAEGNLAPDFGLTDIFGRLVSRSSLVADRPGLLFFTTTYCLPCVEGLQALKQFQREVGSDRFHVLIVFVDPRESITDLQAYQARYTFPLTWYYASDTDELLGKYRVRSLDTKFALDRQGTVRFVDIYPATTETWRTALAAVGIAR